MPVRIFETVVRVDEDTLGVTMDCVSAGRVKQSVLVLACLQSLCTALVPPPVVNYRPIIGECWTTRKKTSTYRPMYACFRRLFPLALVPTYVHAINIKFMLHQCHNDHVFFRNLCLTLPPYTLSCDMLLLLLNTALYTPNWAVKNSWNG